MKGIDQLRDILQMMDKNEREVLRNYLTCFESRKKGHKPKTLVLLQLIEKYDDDQKVNILFKKKIASEDARRMVVFRLRQKMLATLTLDVNLKRDEIYDEQAQARADVNLSKLQGAVLLGRGQRKLGFKVLDRAIKLAREYEFFDDLVEMLALQRRYVKAWKGTDKAFYDKVAEIETASASRDASNLAMQYFEEVTMRYGFKGLSRLPADPKQVTFLHERTELLKQAFEKTGAATVGYYYYFLLVELNQLQSSLVQASDALSKLAELLNRYPAIRRNVRLASVHLNLGVNDLWQHKFSEAQEQFNTALKYVRENTRNHAIISELLFYSKFYAGKLDEAESLLEALTESKYVDQSEFRKGVRSYLLACVSFAKGELRKVNLRLANSHNIGKDKEGWNIGSRVLSIMLAIEREKFDYADSQIINLRQFMRDGLKGIEVRNRDKLILEVLVELRRMSYDFNEVSKSKKPVLEQLYAENAATGWLLQTPEMICFHTWFDDKLGGRSYTIDYSKAFVFHQP